MLNDNEKNRYSRHILLNEVGLVGQQKLKAAKVMVIGAGGLGCPVLQYLTAAGVGTIGVIDFDVVDETNLQRQILFTVNDIGKNKAIAAKERLELLNPYITINTYPEKLTTQNALGLFKEYDIVIDGTDNFATRYLVNDACVITNKPLIYGSIFKFEGQVAVFNYQNGPSYRCLFPEPPTAGTVPSCSEIGVIGVLPGLIGTQQANEAIKLILGIGKPLSGKLLIYDSLKASSTTLGISRSEKEVQKVLDNKVNFATTDYDFFCGIQKQELLDEITIEELKDLINKKEVQVVDVREDWEQPRIEELNALIAPMDNLEEYVSNISKDKKVVVICQSGGRSRAAIEHLKKEHHFKNLINLSGGVMNWK